MLPADLVVLFLHKGRSFRLVQLSLANPLVQEVRVVICQALQEGQVVQVAQGLPGVLLMAGLGDRCHLQVRHYPVVR